MFCLIMDISQLIHRASELFYIYPGMVFLGVYSIETHLPMALLDREHVQINIDNEHNTSNRELAIEIQPSQVAGIVSHLRNAYNNLIELNIANMEFVCMRTTSGCVTGMSHFNTDENIMKLANETVFRVTKTPCSQIKGFTGYHALAISALLKDDKLLVSLSTANTCSSLKFLHKVLQTSEAHKIYDKQSPKLQANELHFDFTHWDFQTENKRQHNCGADEMHLKIKTDKNIGKGKYRRESSFCEDWRTATLKSIEILKFVGPFSDSGVHDDKIPLIDTLGDAEIPEIAANVPGENKNTKVARTASRATLV